MRRSSLRSPIPPDIREKLAEDPWMSKCCLPDIGGYCLGRVEWMHVFTYGGKRQNEVYLILPGCHWHHYHEAKFREEIHAVLRKRIESMGKVDEFRAKYPKSDLFR